MKSIYNFTILLAAVLTFAALAACDKPSSKSAQEYVIRVGDRVLTVRDFDKAFEIAKIAYPQKAMQDPVALKEAQLRLLRQMTEEMIIIERAKELGIEISVAEVEKAVSEIKKDYPEDVFEQTLLAYAVSYNSWEAGLKKRLLVEKVIGAELDKQILITPGEISKYYEEYYVKDGSTSDFKNGSGNITEIIVKNLRRQKLEAAYKPWMERLQKKYAIEVNNAQLAKIIGS
jgi:hypothetical protein